MATSQISAATTSKAGERPSVGYQLFTLTLCIFGLVMLAVRATVAMEPESLTILDYADDALCVLFLADFIVCLVRAPNRMKYFLTWGWIDLLSSIPALDAARWGRIARASRVLRVLRGIRASGIVARVILHHRGQSMFTAACCLGMLLILVASMSVLHFEKGSEGNILTAEDALWWSFTTITTVGYGDRYPVTPEGRAVAVLLMAAGVGLVGVFSGLFAAWFMGSAVDEEQREMAVLRREIAELRAIVEERLPGVRAQQKE